MTLIVFMSGPKDDQCSLTLQNVAIGIKLNIKHQRLGVLVDHSLKFHLHTSLVIGKANQILSVIKRNFSP